MEKDNAMKVAVKEDGVKKSVAGPEEKSMTAAEVCCKKYLKQLNDTTGKTHLNYITNRLRAARDYAKKKAGLGSEFDKLKIEPEEAKDETPKAAKPAPGAVSLTEGSPELIVFEKSVH